jgi:hypothetical protein
MLGQNIDIIVSWDTNFFGLTWNINQARRNVLHKLNFLIYILNIYVFFLLLLGVLNTRKDIF